MITYKSKKDPSIIITSDGVVDPKYKTVLITFQNGKTQSISNTTLAKQWEIIENSPTQELNPPDYPSLAEFAESVARTMGGSIKLWDSQPNIISILLNEKSVMEICVSRKGFKARVKPEILRSDEEYVAHSYNFGATVSLTYDDKGYSALESLITRSIVYKTNKPKRKKHKKEEQ